jgi:predicted phage terminase large subunit-like protein
MEEIRYWDRAATEAQPGVDTSRASWTAGARLGRTTDGRWFLSDMVRGQWSPLGVERAIRATAEQDARGVTIGIEEDPGQAGKSEARMQARNLAGWNVRLNRVHESKVARAGVGKGLPRSRSLSSQVEAGNFFLVAGPWNEAFIQEMVNFDGTPGTPSDQVDATSGAFFLLSTMKRAGAWGR